MSELIVINDSCEQCGVTFLGSENYCRNCGLQTVVPVCSVVEAQVLEPRQESAVVSYRQSTMTPRREQSLVAEVLDNRLFVVAILLCAGPMGLPALWFSPRFSKRTKIITTTGYGLFTVVLPLAITWYFCDIAVRPILDALGG